MAQTEFSLVVNGPNIEGGYSANLCGPKSTIVLASGIGPDSETAMLNAVLQLNGYKINNHQQLVRQ